MIALIRKVSHKLHFAFLRLKIRKLSSSTLTRKLLTRKPQQDEDPAFRTDYVQYVSEISSAEMAASYECIALLKMMCNLYCFKKILDFGSGFSSYTFRKYALTDNTVQVCSVEDDKLWLEKTGRYLSSQKVGTEKLMSLDDFIMADEKNFDLIFFDLNLVDVRQNFISLVVERCKPGGMIIFDDVHKRDYLYDILRQQCSNVLQFYDIRPLTLDQFGRFSLLGVKHS